MAYGEDMMLYWASGSPYCWSAMIALEEKGLYGYGNTLLSMEKKEHKAANILKLNPRGQVSKSELTRVGEQN